ncbi:MAG TPA: alanyl-tRNA editing protein [Polyangiaceae bacterium]|nr:alanyl-tRNA editing protein [Polyangiaceae bacterium]
MTLQTRPIEHRGHEREHRNGKEGAEENGGDHDAHSLNNGSRRKKLSVTATEKKYWADPFATAFETRGATAATYEGKPSVILRETIFYPEGGGQLGDLGELRVGEATVKVTDTQIDDAGIIHHVIERALGEAGDDVIVSGSIDVARRRDHMAQHTAQHMLSRALLDEAKAGTVSARLGSTSCTIDVDRDAIAEVYLHRAEDLVNDVIRSDVNVRALFPTAEELAAMDLRRAPKVSVGVRIIDVEGFDLTPCGGTHCTRTGQIGLVRIAGIERYKGKLRIDFRAAGRALADMRAKEDALGALAQKLTCGPLDVGGAVAKLQNELKVRMDLLGSTRGELLELLATKILGAHPPDASGTTIVRVARTTDDIGMLRALAGKLTTARPDVVAICTSPDADADAELVVVQRGASAKFDCGAWLKETAQKSGGRGGGRPERAEGRLPKDAAIA